MLDTHTANSYNNFCAEVAQAVEQRTENPRVTSSILVLGTTSRAEVVQWLERLLAKEEVASSNLVFRSTSFAHPPFVILRSIAT